MPAAAPNSPGLAQQLMQAADAALLQSAGSGAPTSEQGSHAVTPGASGGHGPFAMVTEGDPDFEKSSVTRAGSSLLSHKTGQNRSFMELHGVQSGAGFSNEMVLSATQLAMDMLPSGSVQAMDLDQSAVAFRDVNERSSGASCD